LGPWRRSEDLGPLRDGQPRTSEELLALGPAVRLPGGGLELRWTAVEGADRYLLHLFDAELRQIGQPVSTSATQLQVPPQGAEPRAWQIEARRAGVRIAVSELLALP
jgi:hypothetical protein